ncbi:MAG: hypothetical protein NTU83_07215 [Candidatus Hydrogenedentes bacterium]|nr:hypothetical protein [Candidatus Hydrogenedentota bacterium]
MERLTFRALELVGLLVAVAFGTGFSGSIAKETAPRGDPCEPGPARPDVTAIGNMRLRDLYCTAVRSIPRDVRVIIEARATREDEVKWSSADTDFALQAAASALDATPPDWRSYRCCLFIARTGMQRDPRWTEIYRKALALPRNEKIAEDHAFGLRETLYMLGQLNSAKAAAILLEATTADFWGAPFVGQTLGAHAKESLVHLRSVALGALGLCDASIALPILEKLAHQYPNTTPVSKPSSEYEFEDGAGYQIQSLIATVAPR